MPPNATDHCQVALGRVPINSSRPALVDGNSNATTMLHTAITTSHDAYQRPGISLRSMRGPSASAPIASPPKNAATTAITAATSWPSQIAVCCVHAI